MNIYEITSRSNQRLKELVKCKDKYYFFEGEKLVSDILRRNLPINILVIQDKGKNLISIKDKNVNQVWYVNENVMTKISSFKEKSELMAVVDIKIKEVNFNNTKIIVALDSIQDPANAGTVFRCAYAFGVDTVVFTGNSVTPKNPKFLRAAQHSFLDLNWQYFNHLDALIEKALNFNFNIYPTTSHLMHNTLESNDIRFPALILLGNEGSGLDKGLFEKFPPVRIAQRDKIESLNVGISGCIIMHELSKQLDI
jgi:tRNA G18 (ribose-2'-O)-methylase SpoU